MAKIYTRAGDGGEASTGKGRFRKDAPVFGVLGALDELNVWVGCARAEGTLPEDARARLESVQRAIIALSADIAGFGTFRTDLVGELERDIDRLAPAGEFHLCLPAGPLHVARVVCRRAERLLVAFNPDHPAIPFLNRLSDYLYALAMSTTGV